MDSETTLSELKLAVEQFVSERDWKQFHNPKNLSMSLSIEAAELMELFQWLSLEEAKERVLKWADGLLGITPQECLYVRIL